METLKTSDRRLISYGVDLGTRVTTNWDSSRANVREMHFARGVLRGIVNGIDTKDYKALNEDPNQPLFNRALRGQYPPGSTIKPFYALAALEYNLPEATASTFCRGAYQLPGDSHRFRDWKKEGHGRVDLKRAIVQSCDVYFYTMGARIGRYLLIPLLLASAVACAAARQQERVARAASGYGATQRKLLASSMLPLPV